MENIIVRYDQELRKLKQLIKLILAQVDYMLYRSGIKKCAINVCTIEETIDELLNTEKSMIRFGDGEITMMRGRNLKLQEVNPQIIHGLKRLVGYQYGDMIVTIPEIFGDLSIYRKESRLFWKDHLFFCRKIYKKYCNPCKTYYNTSISRFYYALADKSRCGEWVAKIRQIWKDKDVVIVEGEKTHNGVGNDLLNTAKSITRIIGPASNAFEYLDEILDVCREYSRDRMFLVSLGVTAKFLVEKLFNEGYRALDIGNLDMEYEWYLQNADHKEPVYKHSVSGAEANQKAGYDEYLQQIQKRIGI
jgi:glycosyltransferase family protein